MLTPALNIADIFGYLDISGFLKMVLNNQEPVSKELNSRLKRTFFLARDISKGDDG